MKNVSISTFINIVFIMAFTSITTVFILFLQFDKEKHQSSQQQRYSLIADSFLSKFQFFPSPEDLQKLYNQFLVEPIDDKNAKQNIILNSSISYIRNTFLGKMKVFKRNETFYIYVQQLSYNLMLKDLKPKPYNSEIAYSIYAFSIIVFLLLYLILRKKLLPLRTLNDKIKLFSRGDTSIKIGMHATDEIGTIAQSFDDAILYINNLTESKNLFMRNMMHELKTPIAKGMIIAETIPDTVPDKDILQRAFERMNNIIKELATVERVSSASTMSVQKATLSFEEIYANTLKILMSNNNLIHTNIKDFNITVDHSLFIIVLKNLLDNGIKFSTSGEIALKANSTQIVVISSGEPLKHSLSYYTQPFSQEEKRSDGFGLGLYIVKTIIDLHGFRFIYKHKAGYNHFIIKM